MHDDALNSLKTYILPGQIYEAAHLKTIFDLHLGRALACVISNDYVDDCLFQIDEALAALASSPARASETREYLLGAIEALRDELQLCDVHVEVRQAAFGI
jgi:hypothetical protein